MKYLEVKHFVDNNVRYKDWEFHVKKKVTNGVEQDAFYLQIQFMAPDNFTGKPERQYCRKWLLSEHMTATEIVRTAFLAVVQAERHELEENFKYKGRDIYNSHLSVDALCEAVDNKAYEHRGEPVPHCCSPKEVLGGCGFEQYAEPFPLPDCAATIVAKQLD